MGDAAGELADRFHFLRLQQLSLQQNPVLGRIPADYGIGEGSGHSGEELEVIPAPDVLRIPAPEQENAGGPAGSAQPYGHE